MPRSNHNQYIARYHFLRTAWLELPKLYSAISLKQPWDIHAFFRPSTNLTSAQLWANRSIVTKRDPTLPHRAGKAFAELDQLYKWAQAQRGRANATVPVQASRKVHRGGGVRVRPLVQPEPDLRKLARVFLCSEAAKLEKRQAEIEKAA